MPMIYSVYVYPTMMYESPQALIASHRPARLLEQAHLRIRRRWRQRRSWSVRCLLALLHPLRVQSEPLARDIEAPPDQIRQRPGGAHSEAERRIVVAAVAHLPDQAHHVCGAQRVVRLEPLDEKIGDL